MHEWKRHQLWAVADAKRERHARIYLRAFMLGLGVFGIGVSCAELYFNEEDVREPARVGPMECLADGDCVLMPAVLTCCGRCGTAQPFEAIAVKTLDALQSETASRCGAATLPCRPPACSALPAGCEVRAVCDRGTCRAFASSQCTQVMP